MKILALLMTLFSLCAIASEDKKKLSHESQFSLIQTGGNTELETYNLKTLTTYQHNKRIYSLGGHYTLGTSVVPDPDDANDTIKQESARNWDANFKYEQELSKHLNGFLSLQIEGNEFAGFKQRNNYDLGARYKLKDTDKIKSSLEAGYRHTTEKTVERNDDDEDVFEDNKARFAYTMEHFIREHLSYKFWTEYIYNFTRPEDYLINMEPSLNFTLTDILSLQTSYKAMYDNDPATEGNKYLDWVYTTSIIAKF